MESILLEQTEQFWSPLSSVGMVPIGFRLFWDSVDLCFCLSESERGTRLYPEIGSQRHGNIKCGISLLGRKFIGMVISLSGLKV